MSTSYDGGRSKNSRSESGRSKSHQAAAAPGSVNGTGSQYRSMCSSELGSRVEALRIQLEEERKRRVTVEQQIQNFVLERGGPQAAAVQKIITEHDLAVASSSANGGSAAGSDGRPSLGKNIRPVVNSGASDRSSVRSVASSNNNNGSSSQSQPRPPRNLPPMEQSPASSAAAANGKKMVAFHTPGSAHSSSGNARGLVSAGSGAGGSAARSMPSPPAPPGRHVPATNSAAAAAAAAAASQQQYVDGDIVSKCESEAAQCEKLLRQLNHSHATVLSRKPALPGAARGVTRNKPGGAAAAAGCDYVMARRSKATPAQLYMMNQWHQERVDKINAFTFGIAGEYYK